MNEIKTEPEKTGFKCLVPQVYAACVATSFQLLLATALAYPTFLIPELEAPDSDIKVTISQSSWTASITPMTLTIAALSNGIFIDKYGVLNTIKYGAIPGLIGWVLVATSTNITVLLIGRILTGISAALTNASSVFATEITRPDIRGSVLNTIPSYVSAGLLLSNVVGYFVHWRMLAWINNIYVIVPAVLLIWIPESPMWLIYKGRLEEARTSLRKFNRCYPNPEEETERQYQELLADNKKKYGKGSKTSFSEVVKNFLKPTGYKPLFVITGMFFFQECTGVYIVLIHTIIFFKHINSDLDVNMIPGMLSVIRFLVNIITIFTMKYFNKRTLMISSNLGMAVCLLLSGFFTLWIQEGTTTFTWVPLVLIILYVSLATWGTIPIPWIITSELFPTNIRGFAQGFTAAIGNGMLSLALQNYRYLENFLGGNHAIQFFFAGMCLVGTIFVWFFLPETHNKKLIEIEEYFEKHWIYKAKYMTRVNREENGEELKELKTKE